MNNKYWENEQPLTVDTGRNILRYFKAACKLQVSMPNWTDKNGESKAGKMVTLDLTALRQSSEGTAIFAEIIGDKDISF